MATTGHAVASIGRNSMPSNMSADRINTTVQLAGFFAAEDIRSKQSKPERAWIAYLTFTLVLLRVEWSMVYLGWARYRDGKDSC